MSRTTGDRTPRPPGRRPIVVTVAGSDSSAGAGLQADLKALEACGARAMTVVTAVTAQNGLGVHAVEALGPQPVQAQLEALFSGYAVSALKSGMLGAASTVEVLAAFLRRRRGLPFVCDPVLVASDGSPLLEEGAADLLRRELLPHATVVTPNSGELSALTGMEASDLPSAREAGKALLECGPAAVLVTGGHLRDAPGTDLLVTPEGVRALKGEFLDTPHTHGTGCVYASAIAAGLAAGDTLVDAVTSAKRFVVAAIRRAGALGDGRGAVEAAACSE